jgi:outer membrane protein assembly factor BamB
MKKNFSFLFSIFFTFVFIVSACRRYPIPQTGDETPAPQPDVADGLSAYLPLLLRSSSSSSPFPTPTPPISTPGVPPVLPTPPPPGDGDWATVAGNPQRTSWSSEQVSGNLRVEWYRPIEAFIPMNAQLIASNGLIYVTTARGLYALNAFNGETAWRFDTELPLGNSPTVSNGIIYVGGFDHKIHALNAVNGTYLWAFNGAEAGFNTNPLVVDGRVFAGNHDGYFYAIGAHGTSQQGQLLWKYKTGGSIDLTAAYADGVVYFASNDNHAYALRANTGAVVWRSNLLPGDGYGSYWPVIYGDMVIFAAASGYRTGFNPGTSSVVDAAGNQYGKIFDMDRDGIFGNAALGAIIGPEVPAQDWANGKKILDISLLTEYLESNPNTNDNSHKPWRRALIMLSRNDGGEYTYDSDGDGNPEFMPAVMWGTHSGNRYPPIVGPDGMLYYSNIIQKFDIPQGKVIGWRIGTKYTSQVGGQGAVDEPQAISGGGSMIYRNLCCDRVGDFFSYNSNSNAYLWNYYSPLFSQIPGYDRMWYGSTAGDTVRLRGNYGTKNGIYNAHGDQNPIIPYADRLYVHRSNTIISYGPTNNLGERPLLEIQPGTTSKPEISYAQLQQRLAAEIQKMLDAGHLRPGYYNSGQYSVYTQFANYFENPGETLLTLSNAYPYLSGPTQTSLRQYLREEFALYFDPIMVVRTGWKDGAPREWMPLPPDVESSLQNFGASPSGDPRFSWQYPPINFYALWKYVGVVPEDTNKAYELAKSKLAVPVPAMATNDYLFQRPYEHNAYIAGYIGFLELQELAGRTVQDSALRTQVTNELNRLLALRAQTFTKDTYWVNDVGSYHLRSMNISRNFIFLVPELGEYLRQNALNKVIDALTEYNFTAPYWFVARYNAAVNEGARQNLYDYASVFQAYATVINLSRTELTPYLDASAFAVGDLFYIQNLVTAMQAD